MGDDMAPKPHGRTPCSQSHLHLARGHDHQVVAAVSSHVGKQEDLGLGRTAKVDVGLSGEGGRPGPTERRVPDELAVAPILEQQYVLDMEKPAEFIYCLLPRRQRYRGHDLSSALVTVPYGNGG